MNMYIKKNSVSAQRGFTLIESLVAFLMVSIGMLGIASLQTMSIRAGYDAHLNTVAMIKAGEIMDRIRANPTQVNAYAVGTGGTGTNNACNDTGSVSACSPAQLAADDIFHWKTDLKTALPENTKTTGSISIMPPPAGSALTTVTVTINWNSQQDVIDRESHTLVSEICGALQC